MMQFKRMSAIVCGFGMLLVMTMAIALCAMQRRSPEQGLYVALSIAACLWLEVAIVLAVRYSTKIWPSVLLFATISVYMATAATLAIPHTRMLYFYWICVGITLACGTIEIIRRDIKNGTYST